MTALTSDPARSVSQKLIELLEEARGASSETHPLSFGDRLDALEVEARETCATGTTLVMIRVAREAVEFAERLAAGSRRASRR